MTRASSVALLILLAGCSSVQRPVSISGSGREGAFLQTRDRAAIWHRVAGDPEAPAVLYLHGGPGYHSWDFEQAVGALLERDLCVIYLDQRGCGRSGAAGEDPVPLGMEPTVADIEALRLHLGLDRFHVVAHSFGGPVALEYERRHPGHIEGLVLVESTGDLAGAFSHQIEALAAMAPAEFPNKAAGLTALTTSDWPPVRRLWTAYSLVGPPVAQRHLAFATREAWARNEAWDKESGLEGRGRQALVAYFKEGYLDSSHPELMGPLRPRAILFAGRHSEVVGARGIEAAAAAWGVPIRWFENSGHFPFVEEPEAFAAAVVEFVKGAAAKSP